MGKKHNQIIFYNRALRKTAEMVKGFGLRAIIGGVILQLVGLVLEGSDAEGFYCKDKDDDTLAKLEEAFRETVVNRNGVIEYHCLDQASQK